jgi:hypothetical protein
MSNDGDLNHDRDKSKLDDALANLPRDIEPSRDLWPGIRAAMEAEPIVMRRRPAMGLFTRIAAGFVLLAATSATTYFVTRHSLQPGTPTFAATDGNAVIEEYLRSRADLDRLFAARLASLPVATRAKIESNLADLRRAENEIVASLAQNPSDALLHELLMSTYQSEAQLLADLSDIPTAQSSADLPRRKS